MHRNNNLFSTNNSAVNEHGVTDDYTGKAITPSLRDIFNARGQNLSDLSLEHLQCLYDYFNMRGEILEIRAGSDAQGTPFGPVDTGMASGKTLVITHDLEHYITKEITENISLIALEMHKKQIP